MRVLLALALLVTPAASDTVAPSPGAALASAPPIAPGGLAHLGEPSLDSGVAAWRAGDNTRAVYELERWLASGEGPWGRTRAAGQFLLAWIHLEDGRYNRASENFTAVRYGNGPLAPFALYYEAVADHRRGRHAVAAGECKSYREKYKSGYFADDCLLLMGDAYTAAGYNDPAVKAYKEWLDRHPRSPMEEALRLQMARAAANVDPQQGAERLRWLALSHDYGANGRGAFQDLTALLERGDVALKDMDPLYAERLRADSLRRCGHYEEAWALYCHLEERHSDDDMTASWVDSQRARFEWGTRQYAHIARTLTAEYEESPDAELAWRIFWAWWRAGEWREAGQIADDAHEKYSGHYRWRWNRDQIAHAWQLAGDYEKAREYWDLVAADGGAVGWAGQFYGAFASYRAGDYDQALTRLDALVERGGEYGVAARYYRAKTRVATGDQAGAREDFQAVLEADPWGWYGQLVQSRLRAPPERPDPALQRVGRWPGERPESHFSPPEATRSATPVVPRALAPGERPVDPEPRTFSWAALAWSPREADAGARPLAARPPEAPEPTPLDEVLPAGDLDNTMFDPEDARNTFNRVADAHRARYPDLQAASDLAAVGLHELSAPLVAEIYEQWKRTRPTAVSFAQWRQIFLYAGDHHHASKATTGLEVGAKTPEQVVDALQLSYPAAYRKEVVYWAKLYDLDPLLILGVMRQESLYQTWAVSSAGAVGLMQVMPITGAKIADALEEPLYSPVSLEDPLVSIRYGSWYLMKLMERFDGIWPMAVASYNTGPTNLSTFYRSFREGGASIDVDDLVEQIPYKETRDYVKRITGHYARYLSLYAPEGAYLYVPLSPAGDHREVVDF